MSSRIFYNSQSEAIQLGRRIGIGGEGTVYEIEGQSDFVAKIYHEAPPPEKVEKLIALSRLGADRLFNLSAWPVDVLRDQAFPTNGGLNANIIGFLMKKIGEAEEVHALHSPKSRLRKFPDASWAFLIYAAANIARAVSVMHEHGYVVGDVNPKNILITRKATVYLLDCDSFQISADGKTYRCEGGFPEYTPPELHGLAFKDVERNQTHDCFGLAIVIFQLLFLGRHPFSGRFLGAGEMPLERAIREHRFAFGSEAASRQMQPPPGTLALDAIPSSITEMFRRAFLSSHRPQARDWVEPLESLAKSLKKCNLHSGHYYFQELAECPWCEIELQARIRLFNFESSAPNQNRGPFRLDEIWREIESVAAVNFSQALEQAPGHQFQPLLTVSEQTREFVRERRGWLYTSVLFAIVVGFLSGYIAGFYFGVLLIAGAVYLTRKIAGEATAQPQQVQPLMHPQGAQSKNPIVQQIEAARENAEENLRQIKERWQKEASSDRFLEGLSNLQSQKETYQNLAKIREYRLDQLEKDAKAAQFDDFLAQHQIADADIEEVNLATQILLRSYGIETAADLSRPRLEQIQTLDEERAANLCEWRWELARKFVFDPANGVTPQAKIAVEREMDELRLRLEHEISGGAYYLRRVKYEIEGNQRKLQPLLAGAQKSLAQTEKDYDTVTKPASAKLAIVLLIIAFVTGLSLNSDAFKDSFDRFGHDFDFPAEDFSAPPSQPAPAVETMDPVSLEDHEKAVELYKQGMKFSGKSEFEDAADRFRRAIALDPQFGAAHQELGYALIFLGWYKDSISASEEAIKLNKTPAPPFEPYYHLGLAHIAQNDMYNAKYSLLNSIRLMPDATDWKEKHIDAYYQLGLVLLKLYDIEAAIASLEDNLRTGNGQEIQQFELGNLYLRVGKIEKAEEQYEQLKTKNKALAAALKKLMAKYNAQ